MITQTALRSTCLVSSEESSAMECVPDQAAPDFFPEDRFTPLPEHEAQYGAIMDRGYRTMRKRRVIITGLARNVADVLPKTMARMERLGRLFADYRVVLYENDSTDGTRQSLKDWCQRDHRVTLLTEIRHDPVNRSIRCLQRAARMAYYRNQYHAHIAEHHADYDDVIIIDTDLCGGWSYDGIANTFGHENWDFVGAYGLIYRRIGRDPNYVRHYDAWAFRQHDDYRPMTTKTVNGMLWDRGEPLVPVTSCFGGVGVYRTEAFLAGKYDGGDSEHIALHRSMRENGYGRVFLNPSQVTLYGRRRRKCDRFVALFQRVTAACRLRQLPVWY